MGVLAGMGYEQLRPNDRVSEVSGRTTLETRSLQFAIRRSLSKRFAISTNVQIMQRHELYRTDLTERFFETVYNSTALVVGGERFGDSVLVVPRQRIQSDRYATFTRTNIGIVGEYLFSTRFCEYAMYGGLNIAVSQKWNGSRMVQRELPGFSIWEGVNPIIEDRRGPYNSIGTVSGLFSYVLGARASKPIGGQFRILLDGRLVLDSDYSIESAYREIFTETGNSVSLSLGLGWRFN